MCVVEDSVGGNEKHSIVQYSTVQRVSQDTSRIARTRTRTDVPGKKRTTGYNCLKVRINY